MFIVETVEQANDKKLGRIISLLFRSTSHIDGVQEQNDLYYQLIHQSYNFIDNDNYFLSLPQWDHGITMKAKDIVETRDKKNIKKHSFRNKKLKLMIFSRKSVKINVSSERSYSHGK